MGINAVGLTAPELVTLGAVKSEGCDIGTAVLMGSSCSFRLGYLLTGSSVLVWHWAVG